MVNAADIKALLPLASAVFQADQAKMAVCKQAELRLRAKLAELARSSGDARDHTFQAAGAARKWDRYLQDERRKLNIELSRNLARQEQLRQALRRSFGRQQVLTKLSEQTK